MKSDFLVAVTQLAAERNLPREIVLSAIEAALVSAYRKDSITTGQNISVKLDPGSGEITAHVLKTVVEEVTDELMEISLVEAQKIHPDASIGDSITTESLPHSTGRIAAQTAKQVVLQRLREAERELVYEKYSSQEGEVVSVTVQRIEPRQIIVDLGSAEAILPASEQVPAERYRPGQKMKVLLQSVQRSTKGPELIVSRADRVMLKRLFELEVPEIYSGAVEIVAISREPGLRSKVAVRARQDKVDPVGSCVGLRGVRIQNIVNELQGEKIDVVGWTKDPSAFIANALSPSQVMRVNLDEETQTATAIVPDRQLSLAIGREGQNARLATKLTGWNVDIRSNVEDDTRRVVQAQRKAEAAAASPVEEGSDIDLLGLGARTLNVLTRGGITKVGELLAMTKDQMLEIKSFGEKSYLDVQERLRKAGLQPTEVAVEPEPETPEAEEAALEPIVRKAEEAVAEEQVDEAVETEAEIIEVEAPGEEAPAPESAVETIPAEILPPIPETEAVPVEAIGLVEAPVIEALEPEEEKIEEAVPVLERSTSLRDVSDSVWSVRSASRQEPGQIRFAEDIEGLRGGVTARRKRTDDVGGRRKRKGKATRRGFRR